MKINKILKKILIKLALHGIHNRKDALVYLNGEIFLGNAHPYAIFQYLSRKKLLRNFIVDFYRPLAYKMSKEQFYNFIQKKVKEIEENGCFDDKLQRAIWEFGIRNLSFTRLPIALGHFIKNFSGKEAIYLILTSIANISLPELINKLHNKYPSATIFDDNTNEILFNPKEKLEKIDNEKYWLICNIRVNNFNGLKNIKDSILNDSIKNNLSYISGHKNQDIKYKVTGTSIYTGISLQHIDQEMDDNNDDKIADNIFLAVKDAVNDVNQYFKSQGIDNYLKSPDRYWTEHYHYF